MKRKKNQLKKLRKSSRRRKGRVLSQNSTSSKKPSLIFQIRIRIPFSALPPPTTPAPADRLPPHRGARYVSVPHRVLVPRRQGPSAAAKGTGRRHRQRSVSTCWTTEETNDEINEWDSVKKAHKDWKMSLTLIFRKIAGWLLFSFATYIHLTHQFHRWDSKIWDKMKSHMPATWPSFPEPSLERRVDGSE